jgi:hypothetical protein
MFNNQRVGGLSKKVINYSINKKTVPFLMSEDLR